MCYFLFALKADSSTPEAAQIARVDVSIRRCLMFRVSPGSCGSSSSKKGTLLYLSHLSSGRVVNAGERAGRERH